MKRSLFAIIVSLCSCHAALAQEPIRLTLDQAIALGMQASHRLAEMTARQDAARAVAEQRSAAGQPQLAALASYMRINHNEEFGVPDPVVGRRVIYPDLPNIMRSRIDLQWPIYTGGSIDALSRAARAEIEATGPGSRGGPGRPEARHYARVLGGCDLARVERGRPPGARAYDGTSHRCAQPARRGSGASERCVDHRGAPRARADAQHRIRQHRRSDSC